jgi:hypothetical protein
MIHVFLGNELWLVEVIRGFLWSSMSAKAGLDSSCGENNTQRF